MTRNGYCQACDPFFLCHGSQTKCIHLLSVRTVRASGLWPRLHVPALSWRCSSWSGSPVHPLTIKIMHWFAVASFSARFLSCLVCFVLRYVILPVHNCSLWSQFACTLGCIGWYHQLRSASHAYSRLFKAQRRPGSITDWNTAFTLSLRTGCSWALWGTIGAWKTLLQQTDHHGAWQVRLVRRTLMWRTPTKALWFTELGHK